MTDAAFETFWQTHPRAANRAETKKAFEAEVARGTSAAWIIHSAKAYKVAEKGTARQYLAQSDNWLKNKRWQDFPELTAANSTAIGDTDATARFWAQTINEGRFVPASAIAPHVAAHMVKSGLVSTAQLAMNGVRL